MGDFEEMTWPNVKFNVDLPAIKRYALLKGTVINVFNQQDGLKHRQETAHDIFFTQDDIFPQEEDGIYRVALNKGDWLWFEVDVLDLHDVKLNSRRKSYEDKTRASEIETEFVKELEKEIDDDIIRKIREALQKQPAPTVAPFANGGGWIKSNKSVSSVDNWKDIYNQYLRDYGIK